jgi:hypothetical protein
MGGDGGMEMRTGVWGEGRERDWSVERKAGEGGEEEGGEREREREREGKERMGTWVRLRSLHSQDKQILPLIVSSIKCCASR